jgi:hypothetical protein
MRLLSFILTFQKYRGGGGYTIPHDSTIGVGAGFYLFGAAVLVFIAGGIGWAYWNDKPWKGRFVSTKTKSKSLHK